MSHELRTPLNAILGFSELMAQDANLTTDQQENLAIINRSGDHLLGLINDVLDLSKIEAGEVVLEHVPFQMTELLRELHLLYTFARCEFGLDDHAAQAVRHLLVQRDTCNLFDRLRAVHGRKYG